MNEGTDMFMVHSASVKALPPHVLSPFLVQDADSSISDHASYSSRISNDSACAVTTHCSWFLHPELCDRNFRCSRDITADASTSVPTDGIDAAYKSSAMCTAPDCDGLKPSTDNIIISSSDRVVLIILNTDTISLPLLTRLRASADIVICADGGANRLYDATIASCRHHAGDYLPLNAFIPDRIIGDLDSLRDDVRHYYTSRGTRVVQYLDVDSTDLDKCLFDTYMASKEILVHKCGGAARDASGSRPPCCSRTQVLIAGGLSGRFDHELGVMNSLHMWSPYFHSIKLIDSINCVFVLCPGTHCIFPLSHIDGPTCGIVPLSGAVSHISTQGLTWDLDGSRPLRMGVFVSTSNRILDSSYVDVTTEADATIPPSNASPDRSLVVRATSSSDSYLLSRAGVKVIRLSANSGITIRTSEPVLWTSEHSCNCK